MDRALVIGALATVLAGCGGGPAGVPLGEEIVVGHNDSASGTSTTLGITVLSVEEGTIEELEAAGLEFDPDEQVLQPYYVVARYANQGDAAVERTMRVSLEDADGNLLSPTVILDFAGEGPSGPCPSVSDGELPPGDEFEDCTLFLVDPATTVSVVSFLSQPADGDSEFVSWTVE